MNISTLFTAAFTLLLAAPVHAGGYCPVAPVQIDSTSPAAPHSRTRLLIEGMRSESCPLLVKAALHKLAGVSDVDVDASKNTVTVTFDPGLVSLRQIQATIKDQTGFDSKPID